MNIDTITNGFVIDHITAGRGMKLYELLNNMIGKNCTVLFETESEGYTENYCRVKLNNQTAKLGEIIPVKIIGKQDNILIAQPL